MSEESRTLITSNPATVMPQSIDQFTPLSETDWYFVSKITQASLGPNDTLYLDVAADAVNGEGPTLKNKMIIEVTSFFNDALRVRFNPKAAHFSDYGDNMTGVITTDQLDRIKLQEQQTGCIDISDWRTVIKITLNQVVVLLYPDKFYLKIYRIRDGVLLHEDGWCIKPGSTHKTQGLLFVNPACGSAVAALKAKACGARYYGGGQCDSAPNRMPVDLEHTGQTLSANVRDKAPHAYTQNAGTSVNTETFCLEQHPDYAYGLFLDNAAQCYFNFSDAAYPSNMASTPSENFEHCYFFGVLYGELDYHLIFGAAPQQEKGPVASVLERFKNLTGQAWCHSYDPQYGMPPITAFDFPLWANPDETPPAPDTVLCAEPAATWQHLAALPSMALHMALRAQPLMDATLANFGQHAPTPNANEIDPILLTRWVQTTCLLPICTPQTPAQATLNDPFDEQQKTVRDILRVFLNLRVRWCHILYNSLYEFTQNGLPIIKPTCLYEGGGANGFEQKQNDQFFLGRDDILVAPVCTPPAQISDSPSTYDHRVWLPTKQKWFPYDACNDSPANQYLQPTVGKYGYLQGCGQITHTPVAIDQLPIYIRAGAIIPTRLCDQTTHSIQHAEQTHAPLVLDLWPGADNHYALYLDDGGVTQNAQTKQDYALYMIENAPNAMLNWTIAINWRQGKRNVDQFYYLRLRASLRPISVDDSQKRTFPALQNHSTLLQTPTIGYFYDKQDKSLWIKFKLQWNYAIHAHYPAQAYAIDALPR